MKHICLILPPFPISGLKFIDDLSENLKPNILGVAKSPVSEDVNVRESTPIMRQSLIMPFTIDDSDGLRVDQEDDLD